MCTINSSQYITHICSYLSIFCSHNTVRCGIFAICCYSFTHDLGLGLSSAIEGFYPKQYFILVGTIILRKTSQKVHQYAFKWEIADQRDKNHYYILGVRVHSEYTRYLHTYYLYDIPCALGIITYFYPYILLIKSDLSYLYSNSNLIHFLYMCVCCSADKLSSLTLK